MIGLIRVLNDEKACALNCHIYGSIPGECMGNIAGVKPLYEKFKNKKIIDINKLR